MLKVLSRQQLEEALRLATTRSPKTAPRPDKIAPETDIDKILSVLALRHRREIVDFVRQPRTAGEISQTIGLHRANLSRYLNQLRDAGLIDVTVSREDARERIISLRLDTIETLKAWLDQLDVLKDTSEKV